MSNEYFLFFYLYLNNGMTKRTPIWLIKKEYERGSIILNKPDDLVPNDREL